MKTTDETEQHNKNNDAGKQTNSMRAVNRLVTAYDTLWAFNNFEQRHKVVGK